MKYFYCVLLLVIRFFCFVEFNFNIDANEINKFILKGKPGLSPYNDF